VRNEEEDVFLGGLARSGWCHHGRLAGNRIATAPGGSQHENKENAA
jgi:hypothetical protein